MGSWDAVAHPCRLLASAKKVELDARRKAGETLVAMKERGELAENQHCRSQNATSTLDDLGLTKSQSSRYHQEASIPEDVYAPWVADVLRDERELTVAPSRDDLPPSPAESPRVGAGEVASKARHVAQESPGRFPLLYRRSRTQFAPGPARGLTDGGQVGAGKPRVVPDGLEHQPGRSDASWNAKRHLRAWFRRSWTRRSPVGSSRPTPTERRRWPVACGA